MTRILSDTKKLVSWNHQKYIEKNAISGSVCNRKGQFSIVFVKYRPLLRDNTKPYIYQVLALLFYGQKLNFDYAESSKRRIVFGWLTGALLYFRFKKYQIAH